MFEEKRVNKLEKLNKTLTEDNQKLHKRVVELETQLKSMENLVEAAEKYTEEHRHALLTISRSREKYEIAYKQMIKIKKDYEKRMNELLKLLEN